MLAKLRSRLTYANVVATLALFVALGGGSYAAITITGKNVKNSSLTGKDIKNSSLTSSDVKNRSLLSKDFKSGQLPAGAAGAKGATGAQRSSAASAFGGGGFAPQNLGVSPATTYCSPDEVQAGNSCDTDEATQQDTLALLSPNATVVARDLYIKQAGAPGVSRTYGLRFEGTDTSVSCTLGAADTTCNSGGATATIPPGSRILLKIVSGDAANGNGFWLGWRATTP